MGKPWFFTDKYEHELDALSLLLDYKLDSIGRPRKKFGSALTPLFPEQVEKNDLKGEAKYWCGFVREFHSATEDTYPEVEPYEIVLLYELAQEFSDVVKKATDEKKFAWDKNYNQRWVNLKRRLQRSATAATNPSRQEAFDDLRSLIARNTRYDKNFRDTLWQKTLLAPFQKTEFTSRELKTLHTILQQEIEKYEQKARQPKINHIRKTEYSTEAIRSRNIQNRLQDKKRSSKIGAPC